MRRLPVLIAALVAAALVVEFLPGSAATDIILRHATGTVGYRVTPSSPLITVTGEQTVTDNSYAFTGPQSIGIIVFPDSSLVRLGSDTEVQIGAFKDAENGKGSTIKVGSRGGTLRFQIRHPAGAKSSYNFDTSIMNIAVRGTTALLADGAEGDVLACLQCSAGDVVVTVGASQYALLTGQTMIATPNGHVTVTATTESELAEFRSSGLSTALGPGDVSADAAVVPAKQSGLVAGVAAAVIAGAAIAASGHGGAGSVAAAATATPTPAPTGTSGSYGPVLLTPSLISLSSTNKTATVTASQTGNATNQFIPSSPQVVCSSGGTASVAQTTSTTFLVTWLSASSVQTCTAQINGLGGISAVLSITLSP